METDKGYGLLSDDDYDAIQERRATYNIHDVYTRSYPAEPEIEYYADACRIALARTREGGHVTIYHHGTKAGETSGFTVQRHDLPPWSHSRAVR